MKRTIVEMLHFTVGGKGLRLAVHIFRQCFYFFQSKFTRFASFFCESIIFQIFFSVNSMEHIICALTERIRRKLNEKIQKNIWNSWRNSWSEFWINSIEIRYSFPLRAKSSIGSNQYNNLRYSTDISIHEIEIEYYAWRNMKYEASTEKIRRNVLQPKMIFLDVEYFNAIESVAHVVCTFKFYLF